MRIKPGWEDTAHVEKMAKASKTPMNSNDDNAAKLKEQDLDVRIKPEWEDKAHVEKMAKASKAPVKDRADNGMSIMGTVDPEVFPTK